MNDITPRLVPDESFPPYAFVPGRSPHPRVRRWGDIRGLELAGQTVVFRNPRVLAQAISEKYPGNSGIRMAYRRIAPRKKGLTVFSVSPYWPRWDLNPHYLAVTGF